MKEMGFISRRADPEVFDRVVEYFHDRFRSQLRVDGFSLKDIRFETDAKLASLLDLRELNVSLAELRDAFHVPKEWVLLERTLLLLLGVCTTLDPEMNPHRRHPALRRAVHARREEGVVGGLRRGLAGGGLLGAGPARRAAAASWPQPTRGDLGGAGRRARRGRARPLHRLPAAAVGRRWGRRPTTLAVVFDGRGQETGRGCWRCWPPACSALLLLGSLCAGPAVRPQAPRASRANRDRGTA